MLSPDINSRILCPCCGYPTLAELSAYEICELCNWEDDGQGDQDADIIRGGANGEYSLSAARDNFLKYLVMYAPDNDTRLNAPDSAVEIAAKQQLVQAFREWHAATDPAARETIRQRILEQESILRDELQRFVREYEERGDGSA